MAPIKSEATGIGWAVEHCAYYLKGSNKVVKIVTDHYPLVAVFDKCVFDLSQRLWNVRSRLMDYKIEVTWVPGKQQMAADALGRNPVWPGTMENSGEKDGDSGCENSEEKDGDSGYEDSCFIASGYREERMFEEEFCDPMIEELFSAARGTLSSITSSASL